MIRMTKILLVGFAYFALPSYPQAAESNWRLHVAFIEESVGAINRLPRSYQLAWVRRGTKDKELGKAFKVAQKATIEGTKHKIYVREITTNSTKFVAIYDYAKMRNMWKGSPKKLNALTLRKGKSQEKIDAQMRKDATKRKYLGYRLVSLIDMQAAKAFLNGQAQNPYYGPLPIGKP